MSKQSRIIDLLAQHPDWKVEQIAAEVGCVREYVNVCIRRTKAAPRVRAREEAWTADEISQLRHMRNVERKSFVEIAGILGRTVKAASVKCALVGRMQRMQDEKSAFSIVPDLCEADRRHRQSLHPRDLTAALMGDPLPGFSALECRA